MKVKGQHAPSTGPGTELQAIFDENGIVPEAKCRCDQKIATMNRWGNKCKANRAKIVRWFVEATPGRVWDGIAAEIIGALVELAIERAEQKAIAAGQWEI